MKVHFNRHRVFLAIFALTLILPLGIMAYKLTALDYAIAGLMPAVSYRVELSMQVHGHGDDVSVSTYLPKSDNRQIITEEENSSGPFTFALQSGIENRQASWNADAVSGEHNIRYSFSVQADHLKFIIPPDLPIPSVSDASMAEYLREEQGIQLNDPIIEDTLNTILPDRNVPLLAALTAVHGFLQNKMESRNFSGYTDAVTALRLGEASCNGKSRAMVAMLRKLNVPARLVGGLILEQGSKRVGHQWAEAFINGHWVPFDALNNHFAELPSNYLTLYYGDQSLFKHTTNVNFKYFFKITKRLVPKREAQEAMGSSVLNIFNIYSVFERIGVSQNLVKIMLMIPIGALVTVVFRNVIGLETFGTFLPALIAAAARETGLIWGIIGFVLVIVVSALARKMLDWMHLLHSPKMAIMLTLVVVFMLPITVTGITAERFAIMETEQGIGKAAKITAATVVVIAACYTVMDSLFLQSMFLAFPELLLVVVALNMWLGKWIGIRLMEFIRFRKLIFRQGA
ncbi:MAG: UUP1 family membrane protein [Deltaproteobacteria bacterium]|nr:UUP1 family membrane protein [Deltaproteobacteria bacterium]